MSDSFVGQMADLGLAESAATIGMLSRALSRRRRGRRRRVSRPLKYTLLLPVHCSNNTNKYNTRSCKDMKLHLELVLGMEKEARPLVLDRSAIVEARAAAVAAAMLFCRASQQNKHLAGFQQKPLQMPSEGELARLGSRSTHGELDAVSLFDAHAEV